MSQTVTRSEIAHAMSNKEGIVVPLCGAQMRNGDTVTVGTSVNCPDCKRILGNWEKHVAEERKPHYYDVGDIAVIDVIRAKLTPEQLKGYYLGNTIKYSLRLNHKNKGADAAKDANKLADYAMWLNETYSEE